MMYFKIWQEFLIGSYTYFNKKTFTQRVLRDDYIIVLDLGTFMVFGSALIVGKDRKLLRYTRNMS